MGLEDYDSELRYCSRCSLCKWIPQLQIKSKEFSEGCPAIKRYNFHAYSGGGRVISALSLKEGRSELTEDLKEIIHRCQLCGACQVSCHQASEIVEPLEVARELKVKCVEEGKILPEHMIMIEGMREEDNPFGEPKSERGEWAEGLDLKDLNEEEADVLFHAGCRLSYDEDLRNIVRDGVRLLSEAGVDFGIFGEEEACCGLRAFDTGYRGEIEKYAEDMISRVKASGAEKIVTPCADCYSAFKQLYPLIGEELGVEIIHITEMLDRLVKEGKIELGKGVSKTVTYHDPCHLGRLGESYKSWNGEWVRGKGNVMVPSDGDKQIRRGTEGVYEPPRNLLEAIPELELVEMERKKEWGWCCGAGGGVYEAYPDFARWTSEERIKEAKAAGAEALVTACPWCERNFEDTIKEKDLDFQIFDIIELISEGEL